MYVCPYRPCVVDWPDLASIYWYKCLLLKELSTEDHRNQTIIRVTLSSDKQTMQYYWQNCSTQNIKGIQDPLKEGVWVIYSVERQTVSFLLKKKRKKKELGIGIFFTQIFLHKRFEKTASYYWHYITSETDDKFRSDYIHSLMLWRHFR